MPAARSEGDTAGARRDGTAEGFESVLTDELPALYRYAVTVTADAAEAADLVGETVLRAIENRESFRGESSMRTWLHRILYHIAVDRARHHSHELAVEDVEDWWREDSYSVDASVVVERAEAAETLREALAHLPHIYRSTVVLHDAEGWPLKDIADTFALSLPAAKARLRRGRMMLVSALAGAGDRREANRGVPLTCWDARAKISDYLDDDLAVDERALVEAHLSRCATCPPLYQALVGATSSLGSLHDPDSVIPEVMVERIRAKLSSAEPQPNPPIPRQP